MFSDAGGNEPLNMLVVGSVEGRHALQTYSRAGRHKRATVAMDIVDARLESYARLLVFAMLRGDQDVGAQERAEMFLEILGNTLIRAKTRDWLNQNAKTLIVGVTGDDDAFGRTLPWITLEWLKFRDRDQLEVRYSF